MASIVDDDLADWIYHLPWEPMTPAVAPRLTVRPDTGPLIGCPGCAAQSGSNTTIYVCGNTACPFAPKVTCSSTIEITPIPGGIVVVV